MKKQLTLNGLLHEFLNFSMSSLYALLALNASRSAAVLRKRFYKTDCFIDTAVTIANPKNFFAKKDTALYHGCYILNTDGQLVLGERSHLGAYCFLNISCGKVTIGDDVAIGPSTTIFSYSNHHQKGEKITNIRITKDVEIGNNVFIGSNCSILPGTIIHDNVVIGAGSVVKGELKSNGIYAGVPCQLLKEGWYE